MATNSFRVKSGSINLKPLASAPSVPEAGDLYVNSSGSLQTYSNGAFVEAGSGLNEQAVKNYLKIYASASVPPGTLSTIAPTGTIAAGVFYSDVTSGAAALTMSPDTTLRGATNYLSAISGVDSTGARFFQFPAFTLDGSDLGKTINVSVDCAGVAAFAEWDVVAVRYNAAGVWQEYISVAGSASGATPASASIPIGVAQLNGFFVASSGATDLYALRFRRLAGSSAIRIDSLFVGPGVVRVGAAVTDWVSYTPTGAITTNATYTGKWRRLGDTLEGQVQVFFSNVNTQGLMTFSDVQLLNGLGLTVDTSKIASSGSPRSALGTWAGIDSGVNGNFGGTFVRDGTGGWTLTYATGSITAEIVNTNTSLPFAISANDNFNICFKVPIANWSSNTQMADRALEEYASSDNVGVTEGTSYTGNYVNNINGSLFPAITTTSINSGYTKYRIQFSTPIQATDRLVVEIQPNGNTTWQPIETDGGSVCPTMYLGGTIYGMGFVPISNTQVDVAFGRGGRVSTSGYNVAGAGWSALSSGGWRWRVRKVSSGAQIGGAIASSNIVSDQQGIAIPTGYLGELIEVTKASNTTGSTTIGTYTDVGHATFTLTPGVWEIEAGGAFVNDGCAGTGSSGSQLAITDSSNVVIRSALGGPGNTSVPTTVTALYVKVRVIVTTNTVYKMRFSAFANTGIPTITGCIAAGAAAYPQYLRAVRVR